MSEPTKAVFLSYASQDAEAARRICEALRAAGVEVWFDQSELRGGDAWDAKIRKQIKECALFVPVISAATQARGEGYFRLEWKLAVDRSHLMADDAPFLFPVVIDETADATARVPEKFRDVQWTRLNVKDTPETLARRVEKMLGGAVESESAVLVERGERPARRKPAQPAWLRHAWMGVGLLFAVIFAVRPLWHQAQRPNARPAAPAASASANTELARVRARIIPDRWQKEDFDAVSATLDRLIQANPEDADAWALRSIINSLQVLRNFDAGTKPLEVGKAAADRATRLAPGSPLADIATGMHLVAMTSRGGDTVACRPYIDRGVAAMPPDAVTRYAELVSYWFGYEFEDVRRVAQVWLAAEPKASFPAWIMSQSEVVQRRPDEAEKWAEQALVDSGITGVRAHYTRFESKYYLRADLRAAQEALDRIPPAGRTVHRVVHARWLVAVAEHRWDDALQELARVPETFLFDRSYHGPKALLAGLAHLRAGRAEVAAAQFREAERLLRERLAADPDNEELHGVLAVTLAYGGRGAEARNELALVEPLVKRRPPTLQRGSLALPIAQTYAILGDAANLPYWLRLLLAEPSQFPFTPAAIRLDPRFTTAVEAPEIQALLKEFAGLDIAAVSAPAPATAADEKSVAVLAFANLSDDKGNEYFSDGITEELLNVLAKVPGLKVSARTSAFYFKGKEVPIPEIAQKLGVAYVVEGSVRKAGDKVRITAQLIKAAGGFHVWSDTFTRDLKDIFAVQDEIAGLIAQQLQLKLDDSPRRERVVNPEAHQLYLQGKYFLNQFSYESASKAADLLQRAVQLDPQFAPAWAALSRAGSVQGGYADTRLDFEAGYRLAREAAMRALELDPKLADAYLARVEVQAGSDFDWKGARESLRHAQELAPTDAAVLDSSARMAYYFGAKEKAVEFGARAVALDPVNPSVRNDYAFALTSLRRFKEADTEYRRLIELNPKAPWGHAGASVNLTAEGRFDEAAAETVQENNEWSKLYALCLAQWGQQKRSEADATIAQLIKTYADVAAFQIAEAYAFRRDNDHAFEWLERAYRQRDSGLAWSRSSIFLENLRADPRWDGFLRKLGLADDQLK